MEVVNDTGAADLGFLVDGLVDCFAVGSLGMDSFEVVEGFYMSGLEEHPEA
ncbi:MAG: hypothetical protein NWE89_00055 [Candidatus Bathyarchaeota archaeon]|nr:hypothetical protein [Candidatus Bathyarchaeota archaeon]